MTDKKRTLSKRSILDLIVSAVFLIIICVSMIFWECDIDMWAAILCFLLVIVGTLILNKTNKRISEMQ